MNRKIECPECHGPLKVIASQPADIEKKDNLLALLSGSLDT
ncbi:MULTISPECIES: hypothetical protein [Pseudomonas]|nr:MULTISPECIES: hypothetical protein [Pseudomonas]WHS57363.1 hypothetical protein QLH64_30565 [Pseudomonas brassicacearum]